jgi:hypothetical protein
MPEDTGVAEKMKALSLKQPWAWCVFHGKDVENRTWRSSYRGSLLIHASKTWDQAGYEYLISHMGTGNELEIPEKGDWIAYKFGYLIGRVTMVDCVQNHKSSWFTGPWGFVFEEPILFLNPIPCKGKQRFFEVPDKR